MSFKLSHCWHLVPEPSTVCPNGPFGFCCGLLCRAQPDPASQLPCAAGCWAGLLSKCSPQAVGEEEQPLFWVGENGTNDPSLKR